MGGAHLRFLNPQPDTSLHCKSTDTGLVIAWNACLLPSLSWCLLHLPTGVSRLS